MASPAHASHPAGAERREDLVAAAVSGKLGSEWRRVLAHVDLGATLLEADLVH